MAAALGIPPPNPVGLRRLPRVVVSAYWYISPRELVEKEQN